MFSLRFRHSKPKGKKKGPHETRANSCQAYVSFQFHEVNGINVVIIRKQLEHSGHSVKDQTEKRVSRIDAQLCAYIECLCLQVIIIDIIQS